MASFPVYYHVPKCAGTYVHLSVSEHIKRNHSQCTEIYLRDSHNRILAIIFIADENALGGSRHITRDMPFMRGMDLSYLDIKLLMICARGFIVREKIIPICGLDYKQYIVLRDPYDREKSKFYYLKSDRSRQEPTHCKIKSRTFQEYLYSSELEDNWLVRNLCGVPEDTCIDEYYFRKACDLLDDMVVAGIKDVDGVINKMIGNGSYKVMGRLNSSYEDQIEGKLEDFDPDTISRFNSITKWDRLIYNRYVGERTFI